ncbi:dihydrolipoyl dehydrogenase family protein [Salicibibacter kimchii]|uniref:Dihydrolipoyl dehydrogenase n=1 Tax=Salicibibacter kimchii TaxID=2099786 RepID=A0A345C1E6_9BACI|nr:FAD-dependent oxidoreductase [Salicibibacter kimchii]AXF57027.1 FAD-dependent oxidoreductase [Salicibibacter kimchii]
MVVGDFAHEKDVIIIGGGPGGYHAAIRAAQLGQEVALIEKDMPGGVCIRNGCISSKLFAEAAKRLRDANDMPPYGINVPLPTFDLAELQQKKSALIKQLTGGVQSLLKKHRVEVIQGEAKFLSEDQIGIENGDSFEKYQFKQAVIATGSSYVRPDGFDMNHERILDPTSIYKQTDLPEHLIVFGSDYHAIEVASSYTAFGTEITLALDGPWSYDQDINKELTRLFKKNNVKVLKNSSLVNVSPFEEQVEATVFSGEKEQTITASHLFLSCNRVANTDALALDTGGIENIDGGFIPITATAQTNQPHIYAVGDVTSHGSLAVEAIKQGKVAAERIAGEKSEWDPWACPMVTHGIRPIATTGLTEEEAMKAGYDINVGTFPLRSNGYASITNKNEGLFKIISEKETDVILGFHSLGAGAVELISQAIQALEMGARIEDLSYPYYPHPSLNEAWLEASDDVFGIAVHRM